jgi:hypothetical protein
MLQQKCFQIQSETSSCKEGEKEKVWQQTQEQQQ